MSIELTRNFCIIAHIDHGKTTLSDRLLERTGTIQARERQDQLLDSMDLERERGITIKAHPVAMRYTAKNGQEYRLNLSIRRATLTSPMKSRARSQACEGALLIVDAAQGVEAQTVANVHLAHKQGLTIVPVINKIDLPNATSRPCIARSRRSCRFPRRGDRLQREDGHRHRGHPRSGRAPNPAAEAARGRDAARAGL
jgi:GTP-binding protein LepA